MRYLASLLILFGASGFILPLTMRDPPFWHDLSNDAPMVAGIFMGLGIVLLILNFVFRKKKPV